MTREEIIGLHDCKAILYFNAKSHASQREINFSPYTLYLPNPQNALHMFTKKFFNQVYTSDFNSTPLVNLNALFHEQSHDHLLQSQPQVIQPMMNINSSPIHIQIFPNESNSTYDKHFFDELCGLEIDLTVLFYKEDELFKKNKGKIII